MSEGRVGIGVRSELLLLPILIRVGDELSINDCAGMHG